MRFYVIYSLTFLLALTAYSQKLKNKDVKLAIESGKVKEINILAEDQFTPERNLDLDLRVTFEDGTTVLASDFHTIWDHAVCSVSNAGVRAKSWLLSEGKGLIVPNKLSMFYPPVNIAISVELAGKSSTKELSPKFCFENFVIERKSPDGSRGGSGTSGSDGYKGGSGSDGLDLEVQIDEEIIQSKTFMVVNFENKKFLFDPECSMIKIISRGGDGGEGGDGGRGGSNRSDNGENGGDGGAGGTGGKGGTITVSGSAVEKYKAKFTFRAAGGEAGSGGSSGRGGSGGTGKSDGRSGSSGGSGADGRVGQVIFKNSVN